MKAKSMDWYAESINAPVLLQRVVFLIMSIICISNNHRGLRYHKERFAKYTFAGICQCTKWLLSHFRLTSAKLTSLYTPEVLGTAFWIPAHYIQYEIKWSSQQRRLTLTLSRRQVWSSSHVSLLCSCHKTLATNHQLLTIFTAVNLTWTSCYT